nr:hypothetical protein [Planctomycetota bacterium]
VLAHGLCWGWNLRKQARLLGLSIADGVLATLSCWPRLPRAVLARQRSRCSARRSTGAILRAANARP